MAKKLALPKNFRLVQPRVCGFCRYFAARSDRWFCNREGYDALQRPFGNDNSSPFRHTCDWFGEVAEALKLASAIIELIGDSPAQSEPCAWEYKTWGEYWETGCSNAFTLNDGTPKDNGMVFCPYCGQKIEEVREDG